MKLCFVVLLLFIFNLSYSQKNLDYFVNHALQASPAIVELNNQITSYRIDSLIFRATLKPQVNLISSNSIAPVLKGYGYDEAISNGRNISTVIQANRNFLSAKNTSAQISNIRLQSHSLTDTLKITQQDIITSVTEQYVTAYGDLLTEDYNFEVYELLKKEEEVLKKLTRANVYRQADYLSFYVTLQQQQLAYLQSKNQYTTDYFSLNYLAGIVDTTVGRLQPPNLHDSVQINLYNSIFYNRFVTDSLRLGLEKLMINYEYQPRVGAYTDAGYTSTLYDKPYKNFGVSFGVSLVVPIYNAHQKQLRLSQVDIKENTLQASRQYFLLQYQQQVALLNQQLHAFDTMVETINEQLKYIKTLLNANARLLETGDIKISDYVLAITNYLNTKNLLTQNYINRLHIINQINYWNR